ncbi:M48 family metallopeptidase [Actinomadura atramentaria]|uniref:M48 family metallopeptidase n=1 Tax=Actinomadura atramentaria TaxID=1990 RepID=UPI00036D85C6|nr:M48 family metallopeptidase [Actinomadura atramentaria]
MSEPDARRPRLWAAGCAAVLFAAVAGVLAATTPWNPLPGAVPGGRVRPDSALDFSSAELARARAFDAAINPPAYASLLLGLAVVLVLGLTPLGARLLRWATARVRRWPLRVALAVVVLTTLLRLVSLPFGIWSHGTLRDYGLSTQALPAWLADQAKSLAVTWVVWTVGMVLLFALLRRFPRYWWTGAALGAFALVVAGSFAYPVVVEPMFNDFRPLPAGTLRTDLMSMAARDGVPVKDVLVADASRRTTALNAYVSGFGSTRRIVVYDTLLSSPPPQIRSVVAHELGHAKRGDVLYGTLVGALAVAGGVCLLGLLLSSPRLRRRAGLDPGDGGRGTADPRAVALVLALVVVAMHVAAPLENLVSRRIEARADAHALDLTGDPGTFAEMQHELAVRNIDDPGPNALERLLWMTHPSGAERIAMARTWARMHRHSEPPPLAGR